MEDSSLVSAKTPEADRADERPLSWSSRPQTGPSGGIRDTALIPGQGRAGDESEAGSSLLEAELRRASSTIPGVRISGSSTGSLPGA